MDRENRAMTELTFLRNYNSEMLRRVIGTPRQMCNHMHKRADSCKLHFPDKLQDVPLISGGNVDQICPNFRCND